MKRVLLFLGTVGGGGALFFLIVLKVGWQEIWQSLRVFSLGEAGILFLLTGAFLFVGMLRWKKILESQGVAIPLGSLWKTYIAGFSILFFVPIIPFANEVFRSSALKQQDGVAAYKGIASIAIDRILEVTFNLGVVIVGGVVFLIIGHSFSYSAKLFAISGFVVVSALVLFVVYIRLFKNKSIVHIFWKGNGHTREIEQEVFAFFTIGNKFLWQGVWLSCARGVIGFARTWVFVYFLGKGIALLPGITFLGFYYLALLAPIPAALGSHDALQAVGFQTFGLGAATGAAFALLIRITEALFAFIGLFFLAHIGSRVFKDFFLYKGKKVAKLFIHEQ